MKRIIEIPDKVVEAIQNGEDYRYDIHTAIAQSKPYNPSGDCISREALKKEVDRVFFNDEIEFKQLIDNAPTVEPRDNFDLGYVKGLEDGKDKLIKELWNCRNELCLRCGKYEKAHRGACDDCRYNFKNMEQYKRERGGAE